MAKLVTSTVGAALVAGCGLMAQQARADTQVVTFNRLTASATVLPALQTGDTLFVDTLVTQEVGALTQEITFSIGAGVSSFFANAGWIVSPASSGGPRLVGVNIDLIDSTNTVVTSDTFVGLQGAFATSAFNGPISPGTYTLRATGNGVDDSSLDIAITMVPEPHTWALMLAGLGLVGMFGRSRGRG